MAETSDYGDRVYGREPQGSAVARQGFVTDPTIPPAFSLPTSSPSPLLVRVKREVEQLVTFMSEVQSLVGRLEATLVAAADENNPARDHELSAWVDNNADGIVALQDKLVEYERSCKDARSELDLGEEYSVPETQKSEVIEASDRIFAAINAVKDELDVLLGVVRSESPISERNDELSEANGKLGKVLYTFAKDVKCF